MKTPEQLSDLAEIRDLRVKYCHYYDGGDVDSLASIWAEDAVCDFGEAFGGAWVGRETIAKNFGDIWAGDTKPFSFFHAVTNHLIELTGADTAKARTYLLQLGLGADVEQPVGTIGIYDDDYARVDGVWLIARARLDFLWPNRSID